MEIMLGLLLGAAIAGYMVLHPQAIGFSFPNLSGEWAVRPTWPRLLTYLAGRWLGYSLLGLGLGWLGNAVGSPVIYRLAFTACGLLAVFMLLFLATNQSPEMVLVRLSDPSSFSIPIFPMGILSASLAVAPALAGMLLCVAKHQQFAGFIFFTNIFLGNAVFSLPVLLNMKWTKAVYFKKVYRFVVLICAMVVLVTSILDLIKS